MADSNTPTGYVFSVLDLGDGVPVVTDYHFGVYELEGPEAPTEEPLILITPQEIINDSVNTIRDSTGRKDFDSRCASLKSISRALASIDTDADHGSKVSLTADQHDTISRTDIELQKMWRWRITCVKTEDPESLTVPSFDEPSMADCARATLDAAKKGEFTGKTAAEQLNVLRQCHVDEDGTSVCDHWGGISNATNEQILRILWNDTKTHLAAFDPHKNISKEEVSRNLKSIFKSLGGGEGYTEDQLKRTLRIAKPFSEAVSWRFWPNGRAIEKPDKTVLNELITRTHEVKGLGDSQG